MIVETIIKLLKEKDMTIDQLEEKAQIKQGSIGNWNKSLPSVDKIQRVAEILNSNPYYLINGKEFPKDTIIAMTDTGIRRITGKEAEEIRKIMNELFKKEK
ncbi:helix-turn-helix domain-containing protein [Fusobacterium sp. HMSC073F01]|uniref:helix-turn-helix domain-containing protein n=1 Tax=Fusobacterium sp. HMSC073F01 TaxID=1739251 RepID=UPI0008A3BB54|nr:helix-turn-helix domain-containing protein [Fusobacterium sp. HMSC073F01]OFL94323.1 hypothetical protein HMPREF2747_16090 [Fusobacterium sp. HMSC073F01]